MTTEQWATWVTAIGTALGGAGTLALVIIAAVGLNSWKNQLRGQLDLDVARRLCVATYYYQRAFRALRAVMRFGDTFDADQKEFSKRGAELDALLLEAKAIWGELLEPEKKSLLECYNEYIGALREDRRHSESRKDRPEPEEEYRRRQNILFATEDEDDKLTQLISSTVKSMETKLAKHLR